MSSAGLAVSRPLLPSPVLYPQREERKHTWVDRVETAVSGAAVTRLSAWRRRRLARMPALVGAAARGLDGADDETLAEEARGLRERLRRDGLRPALVARCFALVREQAERTIGQRHYDVQLLGGLALLRGMVAEMETGEGKTLTATLAAGTAALAGMPVHVITVNDYLARRDAEAMGSIYRALGLRVGLVVHGISHEDRRAAYACDVTYCSNKEVAFDYLRDRIVLGRYPENLTLKLERLSGGAWRGANLALRGLPFAIVDEADSVLVDEARTPLIIANETPAGEEQRWAEEAMSLAGELEAERHFRVLKDERRVDLTERGKAELRRLGDEMGGIWLSRIRREEGARQALTAMHLFQRDEAYLVRDGKVQIIDEYTGRVMADRSWNEGLHQLVEVKEGCEVTGRKVPAARISYQRFFRRYRWLAGMTGTAREVAGELWAVYRLPVVRVPTNRPLRRRSLPTRVCADMEAKWSVVVERTRAMVAEGRPVLIGTRSVAASEALSERLGEAGVEHVVLSAAQDEDEAEIIARAGEPGRVTVATNMAGRGVDIRLGAGVAERGGLHVILSERHDARRIDRQLAGRTGRQGEPGTFETVVSREDPVLDVLGERGFGRLRQIRGSLGRQMAPVAFHMAQRRAERVHSRMRRDLLRLDERLGMLLAFSGENE